MWRVLRQGWLRFWWVAPLTGLITALIALGLLLLRTQTWRIESEVVLVDERLMQELTNPFSKIERIDTRLTGIEQRLLSTPQLIQLIKDNGLVDRYESTLHPFERGLQKAIAAIFGAPKEQDVVDALVKRIRRQVRVELKDNHVHLSIDWPDRQLAWQLASAEFEALKRVLVNLDLEANIAAAEPDAEGSHQPTGALTEAQLELDAARRLNALRFWVVKAPEFPHTPAPPSTVAIIVLWVSFYFISALAGPLLLGALMRPAIPKQSLALNPTVALGIVIFTALLTGVSVATAQGDWIAAATPLGWALTAWLVWNLPIKWPLLALLFAAITCDNPADRAYVGRWHSPFYEIGKELFTNVAYFTGFELRILALTGVVAARRIIGLELDPSDRLLPRPLKNALLLSLTTVSILIVLGILRGGDFRHALWQFRFLLMMPIVAWLAMNAFEFPKDFKPLLMVLFIGSMIKAGFGVYFMDVIAPTLARFPPHTSGHNDSMLFAISALTPIALLWERPTRVRFFLALVWLPVIGLAIRYNDRRIAYVDIVGSVIAIFLVSPRHRMKRFVQRGLLIAIPLSLLYLAAGWNTQGGRLFSVAQTVRSLVAPVEGSSDESSNVERGIENYNLIKSWSNWPVFGQGFGHAFTEYIPLNDFSQSNFGHVGHNSILWLMWIGGVAGFTGIFLYVGVAAFFFARALRRTGAPDERAGLLVALATLITYLNQAFGDMGTQSIELVFFVAVGLSIIGRLAVRNAPAINETASAVGAPHLDSLARWNSRSRGAHRHGGPLH